VGRGFIFIYTCADKNGPLMAEANSAPWCFVVWLKWLYPDLYASCILAPAFSRGMIDDSSDLDKLSGQTTKPSVNSCESS
jgi:hypothetical protein